MSLENVILADLPEVLGLPEGTIINLINGEMAAMTLSTTSLASIPGSADNPILILSTGVATDVILGNSSGSQGTDLGVSGEPGDKLTLEFIIPNMDGASALVFDFSFLSEEFPEFVGSPFNDYFSVRVEGVEVALDTNLNPISVNNDFFSDTLIPVGTWFDGQTPPLRITAPINPNDPNVNVTIEIADVGDGIYDSAAFIQNFSFAQTQVVYLQFDEGFLPFPALLGLIPGFTMPGSGLNESQIQQVVNGVNAIFAPYLIQFTTEEPEEGDYSTVHVGGGVSDLPFWIGGSPGLLGRAEHIDYGNIDKSDAAFVLSGEINNLASNLGLLIQVIAHEAGHILGLRHIADSTELMYPFAGAVRTAIGGEELLAEIISNVVTPIGGAQNSHGELIRNLGLRSSGELIVGESLFDQILKFFDISFDSLASTLHDVKVITVNSEQEVIEVQEAGNVQNQGSAGIVVAAAEGDYVVIIGKSSPDGDYDSFITPEGLVSFDIGDATEIDILNVLGIPVDSLEEGPIQISKADSEGNLTVLGEISIEVIDAAGLDATEGSDVLEGTQDADTLIGLSGDDLLKGEGGDDRLIGNSGNDTLIGGTGDDTLAGGPGNDLYLYPAGNHGEDQIDDFFGGDMIGVEGTEFTTRPTAGDGSALGQDMVEVEANGEFTIFHFGIDAVPGADLSINVVGAFDLLDLVARGDQLLFNQRPVSAPLITGDTTEDAVLTADPTTIEDPDGLEDAVFTYRWLSDGQAIPGATAQQLTLTQEQVGTTITVEVGFQDDEGRTETAISLPTVSIANVNDAPLGDLVVQGLARQGETLTLDSSGISDEDGIGTPTITWNRDGTPIEGATGDSYELTGDDVGSAITAVFSYEDDWGSMETVTSAPTAPVQAPDLLVEGDDNDNLLTGDVGNDTLLGFGGSDTLHGLAGDDELDGGDDIDYALYSSVLEDYSIANNAGQLTVTGPLEDGVDTLVNLERLKFQDTNLAFDLDGSPGDTARLLALLLGPDEESWYNPNLVGIGVDAMDNLGFTFEALMGLAIEVVLPGASHGDIVDHLWGNLFGGSATPQDVKADLVGLLNGGVFTPASLAVAAAGLDLHLDNMGFDELMLVGVQFSILE